jgi:imidazolonepropionase-like amidohydrolase
VPLTAFVGATVIDGHGGQPIEHATVLVEDGRFLAVGSAASTPVPSDAEVIDLVGRYLLPGLMDANVHLLPWPSWGYIEFLARYEDRFDAVITEAAQLALASGFTTVFDTMGPLDSLLTVRDRINEGQVTGSRMFVAGNIVGFRAVFTTPEAIASASLAFQQRVNARFEAGGGPDLCLLHPRELAAQMSHYVSQGVDFVKYGATGDGEPVNSQIGQAAVLRFSPDQQRAIVEAVHAAGKTVQTHTTSAESLHLAVCVGNDLGQHASMTGRSRMYDETLERMVATGYSCGTQWAPLTQEQTERVAAGDFSGPQESGLDNIENAVRLIRAGVPQLLSTDAGTVDPDVAKDDEAGRSSMLGEAEFATMRAMVDRGMTPMQVVQAATANIARAYRVDDELGSIAPGKRADLVALDRDPLANVENMRTVSLVVKDGLVIDRSALPSSPLLTSAAATSPGRIRTS